MADFCKQCSIENFGCDYKDLAELCSKEDNMQDRYNEVLCEGCGSIQVNYLGECITIHCLKKHMNGKLFHPGAIRNKEMLPLKQGK